MVPQNINFFLSFCSPIRASIKHKCCFPSVNNYLLTLFIILPASKSWVCIGNIFVKLPNSHVQEMLQQDHKSLDVEISKLRSDLKPKVSKLHELEGLPEVKGFDLTALTQDDFLNLQAWAIKWRERKTLAWFHQVRLLEPRGKLISLLDSLISKGTEKQARFFRVR